MNGRSFNDLSYGSLMNAEAPRGAAWASLLLLLGCADEPGATPSTATATPTDSTPTSQTSAPSQSGSGEGPATTVTDGNPVSTAPGPSMSSSTPGPTAPPSGPMPTSNGGAGPVGVAGADAAGGSPGPASGGASPTQSGGSGGGSDAPSAGAGGGSTVRVLGEPNASAKNPAVTHIFTADPSADEYEGRVYVFTSHDTDTQDGYDMVDYHAFSSDDLVNWQDHGVVLDSRDISWAPSLYAPDSCYSEENDQYYLYFPNSGSGIGVATSDTPGGPYEAQLGRPLIDQNTPGVSDVDWLFDPTCFIDDDGQAYLYFGGGPSGTGENARVMRLGADMLSLADDTATTIVAPDFFEASFMHKYEGRYYYSYSTGFDNHPAYIDYMVSDQPMSGFEYVGTILASPAENNGDNNHHSMLEYEGQWYLFYHNRVLSNQVGASNYQRSITLDKMSYDAEGNINEVPVDMGDVPQLRSVDALARIEAELIAAEQGIETDSAMEGGERVGVMLTSLENGDWVAVSQLDFATGTTQFHARVASAAGGAVIEVHQGGCEGFRGPGTLVGSCEVPSTGGDQSWTDVSCDIAADGGVHDLCLRFTGGPGQLLNLDYYRFE